MVAWGGNDEVAHSTRYTDALFTTARAMLWIKSFHIIFVVTWFAGLLYLPRLFVYHCETADEAGYARFCVMERKLFAIASIGMTGTIVLGLWLWLGYWPLRTGWIHAKVALAVGLVAYHHWLIVPMRAFREHRNRRSARFYRAVNEIPALFLVATVLLAVIKPF
jgi:putative membrane protein